MSEFLGRFLVLDIQETNCSIYTLRVHVQRYHVAST